MAKPIKETPFLRGKDARQFEETIAQNARKKIDLATYTRIKSNFEKISKIARF